MLMSRYIFYTDEGYTISPRGEEVESLQVLGIEDGDIREEALANLYKNNEWIEQNGFKESHMRCYAILKPEILQDIKDTMSYLNGYAEKHTDECKGIDDYILKKIKRVVKS